MPLNTGRKTAFLQKFVLNNKNKKYKGRSTVRTFEWLSLMQNFTLMEVFFFKKGSTVVNVHTSSSTHTWSNKVTHVQLTGCLFCFQPLVECYTKVKENSFGVQLRLSESWYREYQVGWHLGFFCVFLPQLSGYSVRIQIQRPWVRSPCGAGWTTVSLSFRVNSCADLFE